MDYALFQEMRGSKTANSSSSKRFTPNVRTLFARGTPDRLVSGIFSLEASTKIAPLLRPSSAAISLAGNLPAILLSLAISSSLQSRLEACHICWIETTIHRRYDFERRRT
jgi:hypothetical protein